MDEQPYVLGRLPRGDLVVLSRAERRRHLYVSGKTGTGKSTFLYNLMLADFESGRGFALIDPHGDLAQSVADATPAARTNDVLYFDPLDPSHCVGFNPLRPTTPLMQATVTAQIVAAFKHVWADSWGPRLQYILGNAIQLLLDNPDATLIDLPRLLVNKHFRKELLCRCSDPFVREFWEVEYAGYGARFRAEAIAPIQNKVGQFATNAILRAVVGQPSTINVPHCMNHRKVLIANLAKHMGQEPSHLLGAFLTTAFAQAAEERASMPEAERQDFTLYVDEFQNFATEAFASILSEARKWRLNLVICNQFMGQLPDLLRQSVIGNVGSLVVFRVGYDDAVLFARELDIPNARHLTDTPNFEAWAKVMRGDVPSSALHLTMLPQQEAATGRLPDVRARTRARYARPRRRVEDRIAAAAQSA